MTATGFYFVNHEDIITNLPLCGHDEVNPLLVEPSGLNQVHSSDFSVHLFQKFGQLLFPEVPLPISKLHHFQSRGRHLGAFGRPTGSRAGYRHDKGYRKNPVTFIVSSLYRRTSDNPIILQCNLPNSCSDSTNCFLSSVLNVRTFCVTKASRFSTSGDSLHPMSRRYPDRYHGSQKRWDCQRLGALIHLIHLGGFVSSNMY